MSHMRCRRLLSVAVAAVLVAGLFEAREAGATVIVGTEFAALDQPRMNFYVAPSLGADPYSTDVFGGTTFNIQAFLDTGASGIVMSFETADALLIPVQEGVVFHDVGVQGEDQFGVSAPIYMFAAPYNDLADVDNLETFHQVYKTPTGPVRMQISPALDENNPFAQPLDVFGMPIIRGRTIVMDMRPTNPLDPIFGLPNTMNTYLYEQGTPYSHENTTLDPGIPATAAKVRVSKASFARYTYTTPDATLAPAISDNPFIGPNPFAAPGTDSTPSVMIRDSGRTVYGSFLFDTGASVSMISDRLAGQLGVRYVADTINTEDVALELFDPAHPNLPGTPIAAENTFSVQIAGLGAGDPVTRLGVYFEDMLLSTTLGAPYAMNDPNNLHFQGVPLVISNFNVRDPFASPNDPFATYTLDGIFGMNFLTSSISFSQDSSGFPIFGPVVPGTWDFITYDDATGTIGFGSAPGLAGDYNSDGIVDAADYTVWADHFGQRGIGVLGDGNRDGTVDAADYTIWADHFGNANPPSVSSGAVPEPGMMAAVLPCTALLIRRRR